MKRYFKIETYSCGRETVMGVISKDQFDYWSNKELENNGAIGEYFSQFRLIQKIQIKIFLKNQDLIVVGLNWIMLFILTVLK